MIRPCTSYEVNIHYEGRAINLRLRCFVVWPKLCIKQNSTSDLSSFGVGLRGNFATLLARFAGSFGALNESAAEEPMGEMSMVNAQGDLLVYGGCVSSFMTSAGVVESALEAFVDGTFSSDFAASLIVVCESAGSLFEVIALLLLFEEVDDGIT